MTRRLLTATAAATLVLGLAACGDKTDGTITDPPATVAVDTSDNGGDQPSDGGGSGASDGGGSTEAAPDIPAPDPADYPGMDEHTQDGAEQAFRYYVALNIWGFQTGENKELMQLSGKNCTGCDAAISSIEVYNKEDSYWSNTSLNDVEVKSEHVKDDFEYTVTYITEVGQHTEYDADSEAVKSLNSQKYVFGGGMNWSQGRWRTDGMSVDASK